MWTVLRNSSDHCSLWQHKWMTFKTLFFKKKKREQCDKEKDSNGIVSFLWHVKIWKTFTFLPILSISEVKWSVMCTLQSLIIGFTSVQSIYLLQGNKQRAASLFIFATQCLWMALEHQYSWGQALPPSRTLFVLGMCAGCFCYYWERCKPQHDLERSWRKKKTVGKWSKALCLDNTRTNLHKNHNRTTFCRSILAAVT